MSIQIYVDGACNKHTGNEAWGTVLLLAPEGMYIDLLDEIDKTGLDFKFVKLPRNPYERTVLISKFDDVTSQQNNGAELLAMLGALIFSTSQPTTVQSRIIIHSDSQLIVDYWSKGLVNKKTAAKMDKRKREVIDRCAQLRAIFERNKGQIRKISGDDNPADLGYH